MLFTCAEDFFEKASKIPRLSREDEKHLYLQMKAGDLDARERLIMGYLPLVASRIRRLSPDMQSLEFIYGNIRTLEKTVDAFDFLQEGEAFRHRLSLVLQQNVARYIAGVFP